MRNLKQKNRSFYRHSELFPLLPFSFTPFSLLLHPRLDEFAVVPRMDHAKPRIIWNVAEGASYRQSEPRHERDAALYRNPLTAAVTCVGSCKAVIDVGCDREGFTHRLHDGDDSIIDHLFT